MKYLSTRGRSPEVGFAEAVLGGLAPDGGLYMPEHWPRLERGEIEALAGLGYAELASRLLRYFSDDTVTPAALEAMAHRAYDGFSHPEVVPLTEVEPGLYLLELYHGPTLAFKDLALQFLGQLFQHFLGEHNRRCTIIGATSGDTGSAAIAALRGLPAVELFMLHPEGRVSEAQRRQMTTVTDANIHNLAVAGSFDDCQALVKALFADRELRERLLLSTVNSINWGRIAAQIVYYFHAALRLGAPATPVSFAVPTGNFGNVFAGYAAARMGLPVERLIVGSNSNDILTRFFESGEMRTRDVVATLSPSMDIQVSSNFERLLFELCGRDAAAVTSAMAAFHDNGVFRVSAPQLDEARRLFSGCRVDDAATTAGIKTLYESTGLLVDPHSIIGLTAARKAGTDKERPGKAGTDKERPGKAGLSKERPMVALATAHPAKFAPAIERVLGHPPQYPERLQAVMEREERMSRVPNDLDSVRRLVVEKSGVHSAAPVKTR